MIFGSCLRDSDFVSDSFLFMTFKLETVFDRDLNMLALPTGRTSWFVNGVRRLRMSPYSGSDQELCLRTVF